MYCVSHSWPELSEFDITHCTSLHPSASSSLSVPLVLGNFQLVGSGGSSRNGCRLSEAFGGASLIVDAVCLVAEASGRQKFLALVAKPLLIFLMLVH
jgi:hypothetical protein